MLTTDSNPPIVITGCPRSGTTWAGSTVGASSQVLYVYEPFNRNAPHHMDLPRPYLYVDPNQRDPPARSIVEPVIRLGELGHRLRMAMRAAKLGPRFRGDLAATLALRAMVKDPRAFFRAKRVCVKDPEAFFASEWLQDHLGAKVVVMARHPAGVISSALKLGWSPQANLLLQQPRLVERFAAPLLEEWQRVKTNPSDAVGGWILHWKMFASATLQLLSEGRPWMLMTHEDMCAQPVSRFRAMYRYLGIPWTEQVERKVRVDTAASNETEPLDYQQHRLTRNSSALPGAWRERLDCETADRIEAETEALWGQLLEAQWSRQRRPESTAA